MVEDIVDDSMAALRWLITFLRDELDLTVSVTTDQKKGKTQVITTHPAATRRLLVAALIN